MPDPAVPTTEVDPNRRSKPWRLLVGWVVAVRLLVIAPVYIRYAIAEREPYWVLVACIFDQPVAVPLVAIYFWSRGAWGWPFALAIGVTIFVAGTVMWSLIVQAIPRAVRGIRRWSRAMGRRYDRRSQT